VLEGLDAVANPMERTNTIEDRIKALSPSMRNRRRHSLLGAVVL
jgi:hypothetical protein